MDSDDCCLATKSEEDVLNSRQEAIGESRTDVTINEMGNREPSQTSKHTRNMKEKSNVGSEARGEYDVNSIVTELGEVSPPSRANISTFGEKPQTEPNLVGAEYVTITNEKEAVSSDAKKRKKKENNNEKRLSNEDATRIVVFPCLLHIILDCIINRKDPILVGIDVIDGITKVGTPLCIPSGKFVDIGWIESIEIDKKPVSVAKKGRKAAIKVHNFYWALESHFQDDIFQKRCGGLSRS
ncbi:Eukaryotic translation initiation factor 5B [Quillaja saponaria]|uniref:Eukaryotic translation initiation factor 5B n=1 Tax=Quillaja saponaria TaxID=32244 RepID=A0AAD7M010_QUISA|nr:Eukaryotic translation initiation factor 5B [Quillaja saponaria]